MMLIGRESYVYMTEHPGYIETEEGQLVLFFEVDDETTEDAEEPAQIQTNEPGECPKLSPALYTGKEIQL